ERRQDQVCALIIVDVDDLKKINDTLGHMEGDHAIIAFANTLRNYFGKQDMIGRIGGDEFLVFLTDAENEENMKPIMRGLI
ncbi:MAG: GGDEF domain-containing protein, partial [Anaerovorax sp.]